ncbi:hypothetical protein [Streptomyces sp. NBC_01766]|uniref:hypothetical protein n=1 Tax=Streptomyces sp. NBC_01766 TaxID=2975936 RepID=UPI002DD918E0|nr:hypothetical protein [Streptomyces sp. NBC_01766]WSC22547.1 hypothetical protein OIE60_24330 [Streptomyces sp. NBC_01766]
MEALILILALLFLAFVGVGAYAAVKVVGAARRGVDQTIAQARRTVEDTALRAKSYGQPGAGGELAQLRLTLRTSMRATQDALHAGVAEDESLRETLGLFERLSVHGLELDAELRRLEREPDKTGLGRRLPGLRERTEQITHSADALRWAARDRARRFADDDLIALNAEIDVEAGALRHWTTSGEEGAGTASGERPGSSSASASAPGARRRSARDIGPGAASGTAAGPEALTGRDRDEPRRRYPWQKTGRPESTT